MWFSTDPQVYRWKGAIPTPRRLFPQQKALKTGLLLK
jgi:hypothetical protein